ncbi:DUF2125 domain-containing protein [Tritonibacter horizontis]|uniref:DUF2125 domain-containing protein n=1 Tax=Tritonibacter horizontis TaxID=1768241 RepID=A0A132C355_9RHOB|nr:DUF2125 domain-containing protein [Tritonibacter horizontis]KUP95021.1 hypothetical protein TRIHO_03590 [Tritonibacter horizontis]
MSFSPLRCSGLIVPLFLVAQAAQADLSAQDVWSDWKDYFASSGYDVSATETPSAVSLKLSDIQLSHETEMSKATVSMGSLEFVENGDGTVNVLFPAEVPITFTTAVEDDEFSGRLIYAHDGKPMIVRGDPSRMTYTYQSEVASLAFAELIIDGDKVPEDDFSLTMDLSDVASETVMSNTDARAYDQTLTAAALNYQFQFMDPLSDDSANVSGTMSGLDFFGGMSWPEVADPTDIAALLRAGATYIGKFTYADGNMNVQGTDDGDSFLMQAQFQGGESNVAFGSDGLSYDVDHNDMTLSAAGSQIPLPISLSMKQFGMNFAMPLTKSDEDQDFALGVALRDFAVPEMLWSLIDPTGELPHDPATLVLDLSGAAKLFVDLVDDAQMAAVEKGELAPGEVTSLDVNELLLSVAGAELTGTGAFTFDNSDLETFDGLPAPSGEANLKLVGANTLLDKLVDMGLLSNEDAMGPRMMMGMFSVPGAGEDTLTSRIEVTEDGKVLANGQRLK